MSSLRIWPVIFLLVFVSACAGHIPQQPGEQKAPVRGSQAAVPASNGPAFPASKLAAFDQLSEEGKLYNSVIDGAVKAMKVYHDQGMEVPQSLRSSEYRGNLAQAAVLLLLEVVHSPKCKPPGETSSDFPCWKMIERTYLKLELVGIPKTAMVGWASVQTNPNLDRKEQVRADIDRLIELTPSTFQSRQAEHKAFSVLSDESIKCMEILYVAVAEKEQIELANTKHQARIKLGDAAAECGGQILGELVATENCRSTSVSSADEMFCWNTVEIVYRRMEQLGVPDAVVTMNEERKVNSSATWKSVAAADIKRLQAWHRDLKRDTGKAIAADSSDAVGGESKQPASWPDLSQATKLVGGGENDAAIVIGIEDYAYVADIPGAAKNAKDWYRYLTKVRGLSPGNVRLLLNKEATDVGMRAAVKKAAKRVGEGGTLWFIFVGHGAPHANQQDGLLVGVDAQQSAQGLYGRSVPQKELIELAATGKQERSVFVVDACYSGRTESGALAQGLQPLIPVEQAIPDKKTLVFSAGKSDQFAGPLPGLDRPAFSYLILGGMLGWSDANSDGWVGSKELIGYSQDTLRAVLNDRNQTPEMFPKRDEKLGKSAGMPAPDVTEIVLVK